MLKTVQIENYRNVQTCTGFASVVKNLPATQEMRAQSLGREDPLEKKMATYSSILAWRISWTEDPGRPQSLGSQRVGHNRATVTLTFFQGGNGGGADLACFPCHLGCSSVCFLATRRQNINVH